MSTDKTTNDKQPETSIPAECRDELAQFMELVLPDRDELGTEGRYCLQVNNRKDFKKGSNRSWSEDYTTLQAAAERIIDLMDYSDPKNQFAKNRHPWLAMGLYDSTGWTERWPAEHFKAGQVKTGRGVDYVHCLKDFWFDIDDKAQVASPPELYERFIKFAEKSSMLDFDIRHAAVESGSGIHIHFPLDESLERDEWIVHARRLAKIAAKHGFNIDAGVTSDPARALSIPGTENRKGDYAPNFPRVKWLNRAEWQSDNTRNSMLDFERWFDANGIEEPEVAKKTRTLSRAQRTGAIDDFAVGRVVKGCGMIQKIIEADAPSGIYDEFVILTSQIATHPEAEGMIEECLPQYTGKHKAEDADYVANRVRDFTPKQPYGCAKIREMLEASGTVSDAESVCSTCPLYTKTGAAPADFAKVPTDTLLPIEARFVKEMEAYFGHYGFVSIEGDKSPIRLMAWFDAINCFFANADNNAIIFMGEHGNAAKLARQESDKVGRIEFLVGKKLFNSGPMDELVSILITEAAKAEQKLSPKQAREQITGKVLRTFENCLTKYANFKSVEHRTSHWVTELEISSARGFNKGLVTIPQPALPRPKAEILPMRRADIIADYKQHFAQFDDIIDFVAAAMFATDRREAFLWIHALAGFGKSFLMEGLFEELGLVKKLFMEDIKAIHTGTAVPWSYADFLGKWGLFIEEANTSAPKYLRMLNNGMSMSPKFGFSEYVEVKGKICVSKDMPANMIEEGVEDQNEDRFSYINPGNAKLNERELFQEIGKDAYKRANQHYLIERLSQHTDDYIKRGIMGAGQYADKYLHDFHKEYAIGKTFGHMRDGLEDIMNNVIFEMKRWANEPLHNNGTPPVVRNSRDQKHDYMAYGFIDNAIPVIMVQNIPALLRGAATTGKQEWSIPTLEPEFKSRLKAIGAMHERKTIALPQSEFVEFTKSDGTTGRKQQWSTYREQKMGWFVPVAALKAFGMTEEEKKFAALRKKAISHDAE